MRLIIATLLLAHGVAHIVGFRGAWAPTRTTVIGNRIDLGASWMRLVGLLWLVGAIAFGITAIAALGNAAWWQSAALGLTGASLTLCLLQLPETKFGVVLNLALVGVLVGGSRLGWF
ncbi:MAG: hypothetical protein H0V17_21590 [Deltaproteobacteria bacterium]|nr:hypothetical protein [Deltaproteobacteria bacterium]